jgi:hypothetical protein
VARLRDPVVGAEAQPAHALGDAGLAGADDDAHLRQPRAQLLQVAPRRRAEHGEVDHDRVQAHRHERVERHRRGEHAVLVAGAVEALREHLHETGVRIEDGDAERRLIDGGAHRGRRIVTEVDGVVASPLGG